MRLTKRIKIDGREIEVFELRVRDIRQIVSGGEGIEVTDLDSWLPLATDLPRGVLEEMAPSEIAQVWEAFREVNAVFFDQLQRIGALQALQDMIRAAWTRALASSSSADTP